MGKKLKKKNGNTYFSHINKTKIFLKLSFETFQLPFNTKKNFQPRKSANKKPLRGVFRETNTRVREL